MVTGLLVRFAENVIAQLGIFTALLVITLIISNYVAKSNQVTSVEAKNKSSHVWFIFQILYFIVIFFWLPTMIMDLLGLEFKGSELDKFTASMSDASIMQYVIPFYSYLYTLYRGYRELRS